ncbi:MAG: hypothetical protein L6290_03410 [Thermodesulfovibrionales bacterium]|nr:hypothetical protein [Thermodesulfovibrionales bacterium]
MGQNSGHNQPVLIILLFLAVFLLAAAGEDSASREAGLFNRGYESYLSYQPEKAVQELTAFLREFPDSSARDAALYWLGKSYMQLKYFGEARKAFSEIRQNFQESPYLSHAEREMEMLSRTEDDAHIDVTAGAGVKNEPPEKRLKEAEKQLKAQGKSLREASEERDRVKIQLSEEKKKTDILREEVTQLEKKEKTLNEVSVERDELRRKLDEGKKRVKELEVKEEACEDDAKKLRSKEKDLAELAKAKESLSKLLDEERKITAELRAKNKESEKREKTIKDLIEERDRLKEQTVQDQRKREELEKSVKELKNSEQKVLLKEKELLRRTDERDTLQAQMDSEKEKREEMGKRVAEFEKKEGILKDIREENSKLKKDIEQGKARAEDQVLAQRTRERDTLSRMLGEERKKAEDLDRKIKEMENAVKPATQASPSIDERESLRRELGQEKEKTVEFMARIQELEDKEQLVADVIRERDTLKAQLEEQKKIREDFPIQSGKGSAQEKPSALTTPVNKGPKIVVAGKREEGQTAAQREKQAEETEASSDDTGMMLTRLGIQAVPWKTGNSQEEKETERLLYEKARSLKITGETKQLQDLINQHKFDAKQQDSLKRFLAVSEYIDQRLKRLPEEEVIESLIVTYEEANRYTKIVLARELQENAKKGMSFEDIYKLYPDMMRYQVVPSQQMDIRIRDKISNLPVGEVGVLWSQDGYMILKPVLKKLSYDPFRNISPEMQVRIKTLVNEWLQEMKSE